MSTSQLLSGDILTAKYSSKSGAVVAARALVPHGSTWKYKQGLGRASTSPSLSSYNDSSWLSNVAPFANTTTVGTTPATQVPWPPFDIWLRYGIVTTTGGDLFFGSWPAWDNDVEPFIDGVSYGDRYFSNGVDARFSSRWIIANVPAGNHMVAVYAYDDGGGGAYADPFLTELPVNAGTPTGLTSATGWTWIANPSLGSYTTGQTFTLRNDTGSTQWVVPFLFSRSGGVVSNSSIGDGQSIAAGSSISFTSATGGAEIAEVRFMQQDDPLGTILGRWVWGG